MRSSVQSLSSQLAIQRFFSSFLRSCPWQQNDDEDSSADGKLPSVLKVASLDESSSSGDGLEVEAEVIVLTVTPGPAVLPLPAEFPASFVLTVIPVHTVLPLPAKF